MSVRGAGGWQDKVDLVVGQPFEPAFKKAIRENTGGFIWWATRSSLQSPTVCRLEVPEGIRRAGKRGQANSYPFVPVLVDLDPYKDADAIKAAFPDKVGAKLLSRQGVVRRNRESQTALATRAARHYVHHLVVEHPGEELHIAVSGSRPPDGAQDLCLDWRSLLDDGRVTDPSVVPALVETLADIREAAQTLSQHPHIVLEPHLRLPLAALVGWEWHRLRPMKLTIIQNSVQRGPFIVDDLFADPTLFGSPEVTSLPGNGPAVLAVSVGKELGETADRYAADVDAREVRRLHVPLASGAVLDAEGVCALAQWVVVELAALNARGVAKELLLVGPVSLAVRIGAAANGTGRTRLPFWDGQAGYVGGVEIG